MQEFSNFMLLREAETKLKVNVPSDILDLYNLFKKNGKELYVVGGAVRDALLGKKPKDFDLATDAFPAEVIDIVTKGGYSTTGEVGHQFGVVIVNVPSDPAGVEIATSARIVPNVMECERAVYSILSRAISRFLQYIGCRHY